MTSTSGEVPFAERVPDATAGTRQQSIDVLRRRLMTLTGNGQSLCRTAAERGIFCRGFRRWHIAEFDRRWRGAIGRSTHLTREQMERFADLWQLTEQACRGVSLACDATGEGSPCRGWDEFSDQDLIRFCRELERNVPFDEGDDHGFTPAAR